MFKVEYYSPFKAGWEEYVAPTFNAKPIRHATQAEAEQRMARLQRDHPRDKFRVEPEEA